MLYVLQIQTQIVTVVLPKLYTYLRDNKGNVVRVGVAIAITKLLKLLPKSINEFQIARLITSAFVITHTLYKTNNYTFSLIHNHRSVR